jgi:hypothetical protein
MITKPIVWLISVLVWLLTTAAYSVFVPLINDGGECKTKMGYSGIIENCESLVGVYIPMWWKVGASTAVPVSILFGLFCSASVAVWLLFIIERRRSEK